MFDTETEKWSPGPELPTPLAFATAVTAPHATFILGGQTEGGNIASVRFRLHSFNYHLQTRN